MSAHRQIRTRRPGGTGSLVRRGGLALVAAALLVLAAPPAAADWLVARDGSRVETDGPWEVKGRLVVFNLADGTLSSMRLDQVDLEASRELTRRAEEAASRPPAEPAPAAAAEPEKPRRKITTADVGRGTFRPPAEEAGEAEDGDAAEADAGRETISNQLVVLSSQEEETFDGHVRISGSLSNSGETTVLGAGLTVYLQDVEGEPAAEAEAELSRGGLTPGQVVTFTADFPEVFAYTAIAFQPRGTRVATGEAAAEAAADDAEDDPLPAEFEPEGSDDDLYQPEPFDDDEG